MSFHPFWAILDSSEGLETELSNLFYITKIELIIAKIFTKYSCGPPSKGLQKPTEENQQNHMQVKFPS